MPAALAQAKVLAVVRRRSRLMDLEARVRELEAVQELILRIMSTTKPLGGVLDQYGATETQEQEF